MAGKGSRFEKAGYTTPKPLIEVNGITLAEHSITSLGIDGTFVFITRDFENPDDNEKLTKIFEKTCKSFIEIRVNDEHLGAAHSALFAEHYINNMEELIVTNCDQHMDWDAEHFMNWVEKDESDGAVVLYLSDNPKNSFAVLDDNGFALAIAEKQPISNNALVGIHYWKHAYMFFESARKAVADYKDQGYPECYVSITYNYLIKEGLNIRGYHLFSDEYKSLGTPQDIESYLNEQR
jgi:dTDP-glucose pyrophosphorylase